MEELMRQILATSAGQRGAAGPSAIGVESTEADRSGGVGAGQELLTGLLQSRQEQEAEPLDEQTSRNLEQFMGKLNERMNKVQSKASKSAMSAQAKAEKMQMISQQLQGFVQSPEVDNGLKAFVVDLLNQVSEKD